MTYTETVLEGTVHPDGTLALDGRVSLPPGRVRVIVQPRPELPEGDPFWVRDRMRALAGHSIQF